MANMIGMTLESKGKKVISFSSDDFYLPLKDRLELQAKNPVLKYRGPPGTHDSKMIRKVLQDIKEGNKTEIPIFDKSLSNGQGDRAGYKTILDPSSYDFCIFEGWFNGLIALDETKTSSLSVGWG